MKERKTRTFLRLVHRINFLGFACIILLGSYNTAHSQQKSIGLSDIIPKKKKQNKTDTTTNNSQTTNTQYTVDINNAGDCANYLQGKSFRFDTNDVIITFSCDRKFTNYMFPKKYQWVSAKKASEDESLFFAKVNINQIDMMHSYLTLALEAGVPCEEIGGPYQIGDIVSNRRVITIQQTETPSDIAGLKASGIYNRSVGSDITGAPILKYYLGTDGKIMDSDSIVYIPHK